MLSGPVIWILLESLQHLFEHPKQSGIAPEYFPSISFKRRRSECSVGGEHTGNKRRCYFLPGRRFRSSRIFSCGFLRLCTLVFLSIRLSLRSSIAAFCGR